jgi:hypothetical protein
MIICPTEGSDKEKAFVRVFLKFSEFLLFIEFKCGVKKGDPSRSPLGLLSPQSEATV